LLGTNSLSVLMCRKAVNQSINQSINQSSTCSLVVFVQSCFALFLCSPWSVAATISNT